MAAPGQSSPDDPANDVTAVTGRTRAALAGTRGKKISQSLARIIARDIAEQGLAPGAKLPTEQVMASEFGVGRTTVREALRLLEGQGLVEIRPGLRGGPVVGEPTGEDFGRTMTLFLQTKGALIGDVLDAQVGLEGLVAAAAASNIASVDQERIDALMSASLASHRELSDEDWLRSGLRFHAMVKEMVGNPVLVLMA